jgi:hypothetical protein
LQEERETKRDEAVMACADERIETTVLLVCQRERNGSQNNNERKQRMTKNETQQR